MTQDQYATEGGTKDEAARQAAEVKSHATSEAADVKDHATAAVQDVAQTAGQEAKSVARDARAEIRGLVDSGLDEVNTQAGHGQRRVAEQLRNVVNELDGMVSGSDRYGLATQAAQELADRGRGVAGWLESHEPRDAVDEVRRFAARNPWTFLAVAAGAGLLVGRFVRGLRDDQADDHGIEARRATTGGQRSIGSSYAPPAMAYGEGRRDPYATDANAGVGYTTTQSDDTLGTTGGWADPGGQGYSEQGQQYADSGRAEVFDDRSLREQYADPSSGEQPGTDPSLRDRQGDDPFRGLGER